MKYSVSLAPSSPGSFESGAKLCNSDTHTSRRWRTIATDGSHCRADIAGSADSNGGCKACVGAIR